MKQELRQHPNTTIIWAHTGLSRVVQPPSQHIEYLEEILSDPQLSHVYFTSRGMRRGSTSFETSAQSKHGPT